MRSKGFTLIELMIVIAIIAIITAIAVPNLLRSRMAANEAAAIGACKAVGTAQEIYRRTDWDSDGFFEYAKNIGRHGGLGNGESLYYNNTRNASIELVDIGLENAEGDPGAGNVLARAGYCFKMQTSASYPLLRNFIDSKNNMSGGYGLSAVPFQYDATGRSCYQFSSDGVLYQSDTGANAHALTFDTDPANGWAATE